jgi:hypothetical protein
MWVVYFVISYFVLALLIPVLVALVPAWRRARISRKVTCPAVGLPATIGCDPWYAVRMHTVGNYGRELLVRRCSRWPEQGGCAQECLTAK